MRRSSRSHVLAVLLLASLIGCAQPAAPVASTPAVSDPVAALTPALGLQASYYSAPDFSGPKVNQTDAQLSFNWGRLPAVPGLQPGTLSARWNGTLSAPKDGSYTLHVVADGTARVFVDDQPVVTQGGSLTLSLSSQRPVSLRAEFVQAGSAASFGLEWESADAGVSRQVIPLVAYRHAVSGVQAQNVSTGGVPRGQNLLTNGTFEGGNAGWPGTSVPVTPGADGTGQAIGLTNFGYVQQNLPSQSIEVGATYTFSAAAKSSTASACTVGLASYDANGNVTRTLIPFTGAWGGGWQRASTTATLPYGSTFMAVYLGGNADTCAFDDVSLSIPAQAAPAATQSWLSNGTFETGAPGAAAPNWNGPGTLIQPGNGPEAGGGQAYSSAHYGFTQQNLSASTLATLSSGQGYTLSASARAVGGGACTVGLRGGDDTTVLFSTLLDFRESAWTTHSLAGVLPAGLRWAAVFLATTDPECQFDNVVAGPNAVAVIPVTPTISLISPVTTLGQSSTFSVDDVDASSVSWTFSDGTTASGSDVTHSFASAGLYTASVTLTHAGGPTTTAQQQVAVLKAMKDIPAQRSLSDTMTASFDAGDPLPGLEYAWTFGDGSTGTGSRIQHTYAQIGTYDFTLGIRDTRVPAQSLAGPHLGTLALDPNAGKVFQDGGWITVWRKAPVAVLSIDTPAGRLTPPSPIAAGNFPFTAVFDASASSDVNLPAPSALTYDWNFGDGSAPLLNGGPKPSHQYTTEGRFQVTLSVKNEFGLKDTFNSFVYSHDIRANIKMNTAYEASGIQAQAAEPAEPLGTQSLKSQAVAQTVLDYFPYVLHKSYSFKSGIGYALNSVGNKTTSFCTSMEAYANGGIKLSSTKLTAPVDDGSGTFCNGLLLPSGAFKFPAASINELLISNDGYLNAMRASVFAGLVIPRINLAVYPDEFLPGDQASPVITTSTFANPANGKTEWIMNVRIRESEMQGSFASGAQLKFKVPVMAVDATGKFMNTVNGRFKAAFVSPGFTSDCGDCTMINGNASITVTLAVNSFTLSQNALDFSVITLGNDSSTRCAADNASNIYVKYGMTGCVLIATSNVYPSSNAPTLAPFKYPISDQATFFGHIVFGETAEKVRAFREYASVGIYSDAKEFVLGFVPFLGSGKGFLDALNAYKAQGPSVGSVANIFLAGAGVVADAAPLLGKALKPLFESLKFSKPGATGIAKALDAVVGDASTAGKTVDGIGADVELKFGALRTEFDACGRQCYAHADQISKELAAGGLADKDALQQLSTILADPQLKGLPESTKFSIAEIALVCRKVSSLSVHALGNTGPYACQTPFTRLNATHSIGKSLTATPDKAIVGDYRGRLNSHHGLQKEWMVNNTPKNVDGTPKYVPDEAPTISLETNASNNAGVILPGDPVLTDLPHTIITNRQNERRLAREKVGLSWSSTIQEELGYIVSDFKVAGLSDADIRAVLYQNYAMLDKLNISYAKLAGW